MLKIDTILLHFLDNEVIDFFDLNNRCRQNPKIYEELRLATKIAFLLCKDKVIIPASHYYESVFAKKILDEFIDLINAGHGYCGLISSSASHSEFLEKKQEQYSIEPEKYPVYFKPSNLSSQLVNSAQWIPRRRSATNDITEDWIQSIDDGKTWKSIYRRTNYNSIEDFENELSKVPERLEYSAFIPDFVIPLLDLNNKNPKYIKNYINKIITKPYNRSFLNDFDAICITDLPSVDTSCILPDDRKHLSVIKVIRFFIKKGIWESIKQISSEQILILKRTSDWNNLIEQELMPIINNDEYDKSDLDNINNNVILTSSVLRTNHNNQQDSLGKQIESLEKIFSKIASRSIDINIHNYVSSESKGDIKVTDKSRKLEVGDVSGDFKPIGSPIMSDDADIGDVNVECSSSSENQEQTVKTQNETQQNLWTMFVNFLSIGQGVEFSIRIIVIIFGVVAGISAFIYPLLKNESPKTPASETVPEQVIEDK